MGAPARVAVAESTALLVPGACPDDLDVARAVKLALVCWR